MLPAVVEVSDGPEVSLFAITDGQTALPSFRPGLQARRGWRRWPQHGRDGGVLPPPWPGGSGRGDHGRVVEPTIEMARRQTPFTGLLYAGLALTSRGLRVVEFNARFGDPETRPILAMLETPLGGVLHAAATGRLDTVGELAWKPGAAVIVVMAADGYPGTPAKGGSIAGPRLWASDDNVHIVHAGTALDADGGLVAAGGRVLGVVAQGDDLADARAEAYAAVDELTSLGVLSQRHRTQGRAG